MSSLPLAYISIIFVDVRSILKNIPLKLASLGFLKLCQCLELSTGGGSPGASAVTHICGCRDCDSSLSLAVEMGILMDGCSLVVQ